MSDCFGICIACRREAAMVPGEDPKFCFRCAGPDSAAAVGECLEACEPVPTEEVPSEQRGMGGGRAEGTPPESFARPSPESAWTDEEAHLTRVCAICLTRPRKHGGDACSLCALGGAEAVHGI